MEQFSKNELIARSRFYYWLRKYRKLPDKDISIKSNPSDAVNSRKESGFISVWIASVADGKEEVRKVIREEPSPVSRYESHPNMEISYQNGSTVRLGGERDMELVRTLIRLSEVKRMRILSGKNYPSKGKRKTGTKTVAR